MTTDLLVGTRKGLFLVSSEQNSWKVSKAMLLGEPITIVLVDENNLWYAAVEHGHFGVKLKRSSDQGDSWEEVGTPQYPPKPDDFDDIDPVGQKPIPWTVMKIWSMTCGRGNRSNELWCGTIPGGLFRSKDSGNTWELIESLWLHPDRQKWFGGGADYPGIHSILIDPRDDNTIRLAVSCGGVWQSNDHGKSWDCYGQGLRNDYLPGEKAYEPYTQDPHCMVQCLTDPDVLWIQHHNGIFRSIDGGAQWEEITNAKPSHFGFAVAVDPNDPATAWFVPGVRDDQRYAVDGSVVVSRTSDGGKNFEVLREGLPQTHAYDLVYRHSLDIDSTGNRLAFGSTTGNLWVSECRGDAWSKVSATLPPIYCVQFIE